MSSAPPPRDGLSNRPTLLYSWWCTIFATLLIAARLMARKIRVDKLFLEDKVMAAVIIPLFIRMALIHVVLDKGTNNVDATGLSTADIDNREIGSKLVLAARVFFAITLWCSQAATLEFILRNFVKGSNATRRIMFIAVRTYFGVSLLISVISVVFACHPFPHSWQVTPDPGPVCREGFPGLIVTGVFLIITNIISICYPIYVISTLRLGTTRKVVLFILFSAPLALILVTSIRLPSVMSHHGSQQYRTVWASTELLFEIFTGNMLILGSYARGTGAKRVKYYGGRSDPKQSHNSQARPGNRMTRTETMHDDEEKLDGRASDERALNIPMRPMGAQVMSPTRSVDQFGERTEEVDTQCYHN
ncbi:hypothetical protein ANO11243_035150 [Dothideomycetidae sp. 11243]|nr:hypothetical protein ANO11243_035150 [fungal sp. No.11243]